MNPRLLMLALGVAVGYVLGTRAGREKYDALKAQVLGVWQDPRVAKARKDVEDYARAQAPVIRERAEAAAKAAPGVIADTAKDVAGTVTTTAKDVAESVSSTAKDVAGSVSSTAKDVAGKVSTTAKDVASRVGDTAQDVREQATKVAADLRERGEALVDSAVTTAGEARDRVLDELDDADDAPDAPKPAVKRATKPKASPPAKDS